MSAGTSLYRVAGPEGGRLPALTAKPAPMTPDEWLRSASEDAERRRRPELVPRLADLAAATRRLRGAVWNREAVPSGPAEERAPETADGISGRDREADPPPGPTDEP